MEQDEEKGLIIELIIEVEGVLRSQVWQGHSLFCHLFPLPVVGLSQVMCYISIHVELFKVLNNCVC